MKGQVFTERSGYQSGIPEQRIKAEGYTETVFTIYTKVIIVIVDLD